MNYKFPDGSFRPTCINDGCNKPVTLSAGKLSGSNGSRVLRAVCQPCHNASYGKITKHGKVTLADGVTSIKKTYCENIDGRFNGQACTATGLDSAQLELDHIDGNHLNNERGLSKTK